MKWIVFWPIVFASILQAAPDPSQPMPPVEFVQARVFRNFRLQDFELEGVLHTSKKIYPMKLRTKERTMVYEFTDQPLQIRVVLDPSRSTVEKRTGSNAEWQPVTGKALQSPIFDTDVTFEDMSLDFFSWSRVTPVGTDSIKTLKSWAFDALPDEGSQYSKVRYWISSDFFAFLRVDAYNGQGEVIKRVEVNGVTKIGSAYVLKEMQISSMIPGRDLSSSRTYIEVRTGQPGSGL